MNLQIKENYKQTEGFDLSFDFYFWQFLEVIYKTIKQVVCWHIWQYQLKFKFLSHQWMTIVLQFTQPKHTIPCTSLHKSLLRRSSANYLCSFSDNLYERCCSIKIPHKNLQLSTTSSKVLFKIFWIIW